MHHRPRSHKTIELSHLRKEMKLDMKTTKLLIGVGRGRKQKPHVKKLLRRRSLRKLLCQCLMFGTTTAEQSRAVTGAFATTTKRCFHVQPNQELPIFRSTCSSAKSNRRTWLTKGRIKLPLMMKGVWSHQKYLRKLSEKRRMSYWC